jgi:hypothetical protein
MTSRQRARLLSAARIDATSRIASGAVEALTECRVGGVKLRVGERRELAPDCEIELGSARILLEDPEVSLSGMSTRSAAMQLARGAWAPFIFVVQGPGCGTHSAPTAPPQLRLSARSTSALDLRGHALEGR